MRLRNYRKGFFRLWLVTSIIWIIALFFLAEMPRVISEVYTANKAVKRGESILATKPSQGTKAFEALSNDEKLGILAREALNKRLAARFLSAKQDVWSFLFLGTVPPAVLVLLGGSLGWVIGGFRRTS